MKRRDLFGLASAAMSAVVSAPLFAASRCLEHASWLPGVDPKSPCLLLRVDAVCARKGDSESRSIAVDAFWENQTSAALSHLTIGLTIRQRESVRRVQLWHLQRHPQWPMATSNGLSMTFRRDAELMLDAGLAGLAERVGSHWTGALDEGASYLLLTPRALTGAPPAASELTFDPVDRVLALRSGAPRDFDALLLHT